MDRPPRLGWAIHPENLKRNVRDAWEYRWIPSVRIKIRNTIRVLRVNR